MIPSWPGALANRETFTPLSFLIGIASQISWKQSTGASALYLSRHYLSRRTTDRTQYTHDGPAQGRRFANLAEPSPGCALGGSRVRRSGFDTAGGRVETMLVPARRRVANDGAVLCLAYRPLNAGVWTWILASLGHRVPYFRGMRVWLTSESLRWLPGSIWGFCSRVDGARTLGVPATIASISLPVELIVTIGLGASWPSWAFFHRVSEAASLRRECTGSRRSAQLSLRVR